MGDGQILPAKLKTAFQSHVNFFNPAFSGSSSTNANISGMTKSITTNGGGIVISGSLPVRVSTNTATVSVLVDGSVIDSFQTSTTSALYLPFMFKKDGLSPGLHTVSMQYRIPGGATFTCVQYESGSLNILEVGNV